MTKIAVVILNFNGKSLLQKFLPSVLQFSPDASIVVADNFSTDGSVEMVRDEFPTVSIIQIHNNLGFCGGYNFALKQVEAEYLVLLNSDVEVTQGWLSNMVSILDKTPDVAAVQPKIKAFNDKGSFEYAGAAGGFIDGLGYPFCRGRIFETLERDLNQYQEDTPIFWATGACLTIRAADFHNMGGFDEDFFAHMEEIDLCWKLNRAGRQVYYAANSVVFHIGGGTLSKLNPRKTFLNFRNGLFLMVKNMDGASLLWKLPIRIVLDWSAVFSFLSQGAFSNAGAVLKAHAHFIAGLNRALKKRRLYAGIGYKLPKGLVYPGSIVLAYFLLGKKKFGKLLF